jgi:hypothetical protein
MQQSAQLHLISILCVVMLNVARQDSRLECWLRFGSGNKSCQLLSTTCGSASALFQVCSEPDFLVICGQLLSKKGMGCKLEKCELFVFLVVCE